jgi:rhomboid protease GluP
LKPTLPIIGVNVIVYVFLSIVGGSILTINPNLLHLFGQSNRLVMSGWYWQMFTSLFVHANLLHLLGNCFFLLIFGLRVEELFGTKLYCIVYFASGLVGNLLTLLMGPYIVSVGASGAIFGLFGAGTMYIRTGLKQSVMGALIYAFFLFMLNIGVGVNLLAHFGGLVTGLILGYLIGKQREKTMLEY